MKYKLICLVSTLLIATLCLLFGLMYYFSEDMCPTGMYLCQNTSACIPRSNLCDGKKDCEHGDDEEGEEKGYCFDMKSLWEYHRERIGLWPSDLCGMFIPAKCTYIYNCSVACTNYTNVPQDLIIVNAIFLTNNTLKSLSRNELKKQPFLTAFFCDHNNIVTLEKETFLYQSELIFLNLDNNRIKEIKPGYLKGLNKLMFLGLRRNEIVTADFSDLDEKSIALIDLKHNRLNESTLKLPRSSTLQILLLNGNLIESITKDLFAGYYKMIVIQMQGNIVNNIEDGAFQDLQALDSIDLKYNNIMTLPPHMFQNTNNLRFLAIELLKNLKKILISKSIGFNPIVELPKELFNSTYNLQSVEAAGIENIEKDIFTKLPKLHYIGFEKFHHCIIYTLNTTICHPSSDGVSSTDDLISKPMLRVAVWGVSCITCLGNGLVLWDRFTVNDGNRALSVIIKNLAVSDMLMGIYLLIISITDVKFRGNYGKEAHDWISSWFCALLGVLAMTSSEVSMFILSLMSVERFIVIANPLKHYHAMTAKTAILSMTIIWITGLILAIAPAIYWRDDTKFYGINGMCFPLHIEDPYFTGWEYSAFIFLGLNLTGLMIIGCVYVAMSVSIWKTRSGIPLSEGDFELALRFFLIILTDAACWIPVITLKILSMMEYPVPPHLQAWTVIFIVPVNSAINPLLYTFTTPKFLEKLRKYWCVKALNCKRRKSSRRGSR